MSDDYCDDDDDDDDDEFEDSVLSVKLGQTKSWIIFVLFGRNKSENGARVKTKQEWKLIWVVASIFTSNLQRLEVSEDQRWRSKRLQGHSVTFLKLCWTAKNKNMNQLSLLSEKGWQMQSHFELMTRTKVVASCYLQIQVCIPLHPIKIRWDVMFLPKK